MGRYIGSVCKLCRRESEKLFLKGNRCLTTKCAMEKRNYPPGPHSRRMRPSDYGMQLREKQKLKRVYRLYEKQFKHYFEVASGSPGVTGHKFLELLETRLDNVVYKIGWASSRDQARQMVTHGHVTINGKKVNIPSYQVKAGSKVALTVQGARSKLLSINESNKHSIPPWIQYSAKTKSAEMLRPPKREEVETHTNEQQVVEFYSR
ncbi:30S ribosomal protein S4 [Candidatus Wirthbacteria bacterium CG2_30_54_11]|uniref:Small ribosomal subunit protein uS4 n=1 Tax=Candidatus Wirthbacteria bacterium CG2_30_54_11 TaxID=1817892 RepID=A0A1J5J6M0_9BACT|nr:MAG: 30S ribosomal protein S4 [Candidatus Wirthbacteria bacterium CG2_30_54_11]